MTLDTKIFVLYEGINLGCPLYMYNFVLNPLYVAHLNDPLESQVLYTHFAHGSSNTTR